MGSDEKVEALLAAFETHDADGIRSVLDQGFDLSAPLRGTSAVNLLAEMYTRSQRFPACMRLLLDRGGTLDDPATEAVLLDDAAALGRAVTASPGLLRHRTSMRCAFTPLRGATLLHVAAEYGHLAAARTLLELGAEVDARADFDEAGLNGHTPLFHTVHSPSNHSARVMELLLEHGARTDVLLQGIRWGEGFDWETTCLDVTPVSYAQLGLLPQMHRDEAAVRQNLQSLLRAARRPASLVRNMPNRYLQRG